MTRSEMMASAFVSSATPLSPHPPFPRDTTERLEGAKAISMTMTMTVIMSMDVIGDEGDVKIEKATQ